MTITDPDREGDEVQPQGFGRRAPSNDTNGHADEPASDNEGEANDEAGLDRDEALAGDQLDLGDDDTRLPWLEGDDGLEDEGGGGLLWMALLAFAALALIIGGIWWFTRDRGNTEMLADGTVIEAPEQPYKEKPADPGGKTFEGTGDTSYAVSEGETRTASLGQATESPKPGFDAVGPTASVARPSAAATGSPMALPTAGASSVAGPGVQVGAYSSRAAAEEGWSRLAAMYSALSGVKHRVVQGKADIGTVYRLHALPGDATAARALCARLKSAGQDCAVKD